MKQQTKLLILCIAIPLLGGVLIGLLTRGSYDTLDAIRQPPLSPPSILFPIVWTILYTLMGIASYLVAASASAPSEKTQALFIYGLQLAVNFLWPIFFFLNRWYLFSFLWLVMLWIFVFITILRFSKISKTAAYLLLPYLIWITFAGYLNLSIYLLNR